MSRKKARLTPKQERFVEEYLVDLNATQAAIRAGYSEKTANEQGARLLANVSVQAAIQKRRQDRERRTEITQDYVLKKLKEITDRTASDAQDSALRYSNKIRALELLGKHLGMFDGGGRGNEVPANNLLEQIQDSARALEEDEDAVQEIQPETADQHELVADETIPGSGCDHL